MTGTEDTIKDTLLKFLNDGGKFISSSSVISSDLTHDGVDEYIISVEYYVQPEDISSTGNIFILGCTNGRYRNLLTIRTLYEEPPEVIKIIDMNLDGVLEIVFGELSCHYCSSIWVYEWNGYEFQSLIKSGTDFGMRDVATIIGLGKVEIFDTDGNGTLEIRLTTLRSGFGDEVLMGPWRSEIYTYMWDGEYFSLYSLDYSAPEYRFQAVQDGDRESLKRDYKDALIYYNEAITSSSLRSWSKDIQYQIWTQDTAEKMGTQTPTMLPPNQMEYNQLVAYAYYRIMVNYSLQREDQKAIKILNLLKTKYPITNPGYPYTEIAMEYWSEFQNNNDIGKSCTKVIEYASKHPEILSPISGPESSFWNRQYKPADMCPFRGSDGSLL